MSDIRRDPQQPLDEQTLRSKEQKLFLNLKQTKLALTWLAQFHSSFFNLEFIGDQQSSYPSNSKGGLKTVTPLNQQSVPPSNLQEQNDFKIPIQRIEGKLWDKGGYWSLDKRLKDLEKIEEQWRQLQINFCGEINQFVGSGVQGLGAFVKENANEFHEVVFGNSEMEGFKESKKWQTLIHGDFKTANIFFQDRGIAVCDFQWSGWGLPTLDVVYLLYTSVDPSVLNDCEQELVLYYYQTLHTQIKQRGLQLFTWDTFVEWYQISYMDYVRFLLGSMWGKVTPKTLEKNSNEINQGMHKRDKRHLFNMLKKAFDWMEKNNSGQKPSLVVQILSEAAKVARVAGAEICRITNSNQSLQVRNKGQDGPQTIADVTAEHIIINHLSNTFRNLLIIGEEGSSTTGHMNKESHQTLIQQQPDIVLQTLKIVDGYGDVKMEEITLWVDPLDGTREFLSGNYEGVTVLIGVAVKGRPVAGVVHQPFRRCPDGQLGMLWWGLVGEGVFNGQNPHSINATRDLDSCIVATSKTWSAYLPGNQAHQLRPQKILNIGGAGNKLVMLLEGKITHWVFPRTGTKRWDTCAPEALLVAIGGKLVDSFGKEYDYDGKGILGFDNSLGVVAARSKFAWQRCLQAFGWQ
eukprot:TRINITY_DN68607_c0_g2_i1.p1 TRINITY_DN68607_c0_g2~~TRINITY_DN68607_c0_g2_i1.p1  ORF type:complete len:631 (-),score=98.82 TRINITY_DN68607_c0_g2_i1:132-2024(-)